MELTYVESQVALRDAFNDSLNMDAGPSGIEITDSTPQFGGLLYEDLATIYVECGIKRHFAITLDDFLNKTREQRITLQRLAIKFSKAELTAAENEIPVE